MRLTQGGDRYDCPDCTGMIYGWGVEVFLLGRVRITVSGMGILICWLEVLGRKKVSWNGCEW